MPLRDLDAERKLCLAEMGFVLDQSQLLPPGVNRKEASGRMTGPVTLVGYAGLDPGRKPRAHGARGVGDSNRRWQCPRTGLIRRIY